MNPIIRYGVIALPVCLAVGYLARNSREEKLEQERYEDALLQLLLEERKSRLASSGKESLIS